MQRKGTRYLTSGVHLVSVTSLNDINECSNFISLRHLAESRQPIVSMSLVASIITTFKIFEGLRPLWKIF